MNKPNTPFRRQFSGMRFIWLLVGFCSLCSCSRAQTTLNNEKVLIVYLSRTNNTKAVAEIIHQNIGGTLVALELVTPYPQNYQKIVDQVARENESGHLPALKTKVDSIETYDKVFVGFPTWGMQLPPPIKSFLTQYDLKGKTIVPFNTHAGYGAGNSFTMIRQLCPGSKVMEGISIQGGVERDGILFVMEGKKEKEAHLEIERWLKKLNILRASK
jgi:flavodoxin